MFFSKFILSNIEIPWNSKIVFLCFFAPFSIIALTKTAYELEIPAYPPYFLGSSPCLIGTRFSLLSSEGLGDGFELNSPLGLPLSKPCVWISVFFTIFTCGSESTFLIVAKSFSLFQAISPVSLEYSIFSLFTIVPSA